MKLWNPYPLLFVSEDTLRFMDDELMDALACNSIERVVNLRKKGTDDRLIESGNIDYIQAPFNDEPVTPEMMEIVEPIVEGVVVSLRNKQPVLVHCFNGQNRSFFVAGLVMKELGVAPDDIVSRIRAERADALGNRSFEGVIRGI